MKLKAILALAGLMTLSATSQAALMNFSGEIEFHNDIVYTHFTLNEDNSDVRIWTDSSNGGVNFDPVMILWDAGGTFMMGNDDNSSVGPNQTVKDSGMSLDSLAAGEYMITLGTYYNTPNGGSLTDGFAYDTNPDGSTADPIPLSDWNQPLSGTGMGAQWSIWLEGISSASNDQTNNYSVPEPSSFILLLLGVLGLGLARNKSA